MKYVRISSLFLIASIIQGLIVFLGESSGFSQFDIEFTAGRLVHHVLVGQFGGYALLFLSNYIKQLTKFPPFLVGILFGILNWLILILAGTMSGLIQPSWLQFGGIATTLFAFIVYGTIVGITVFRVQRAKI